MVLNWLEILLVYLLLLINYPLIRIFKVIGGISILLSSPSWIDDSYIKWIIFILAIIQFLYITVTSFIKIGYIVYLWKNKN